MNGEQLEAQLKGRIRKVLAEWASAQSRDTLEDMLLKLCKEVHTEGKKI